MVWTICPVLMVRLVQLIWPFRKVAQSTLASCPPDHSSVHVEQLGSRWTDFREILYCEAGVGITKSAEEIHVWFKNGQK